MKEEMKAMREKRNKKPRKTQQNGKGNPSSQVITLHISGLNSTSNKQRFAQWIKKKKTPFNYMLSTRLSLQIDQKNWSSLSELDYR